MQGAGAARLVLGVRRRRSRSRWDVAHRLAFGLPLYRLTLVGRLPERLLVNPTDPWPGDAERGRLILKGEYRFAGQAFVHRPGPSWFPAGAVEAWLTELHGFAWLRDVKAAGTGDARQAARVWIADWISRCGRWHPLAWRPDVLGRRLVAWLNQSAFVLTGADILFERRFLASLAEQARHLARVAASSPDGAARIAAVKGYLFAVLCLPGCERRLRPALKLLDQELNRQVLTDGGHVERSPSAHLRVFRDLVELRSALLAARKPMAEALNGAIIRMAPMVRFFRHGDGGLALFNDTNEESAALIDVSLALAQATGRPPARAPHSGFERLAAGRTLVIVDAGPPPPPRFGHHTHPGTLSFEMSVGKERLIVNCGAYGGEDPDWRRAPRTTAAHSTVTVDDTNSLAVVDEGVGGRSPVRVTSERHEDGGDTWLDTNHDGYQAPFKLTHRRRLFLSADGENLRGEDTLSGPGGERFAVRFHLHPEVHASLLGDGSTALLRLPSGAGWRLRAAGGVMNLVGSVYLGRPGKIRRSEQVVVSGGLTGAETKIKWAISRVSKRVKLEVLGRADASVGA
ncbi:MAG: heparinase II/III family protein [Alphaproteobacteria bacterium]